MFGREYFRDSYNSISVIQLECARQCYFFNKPDGDHIVLTYYILSFQSVTMHVLHVICSCCCLIHIDGDRHCSSYDGCKSSHTKPTHTWVKLPHFLSSHPGASWFGAI